ncbi:hypothetical protein evm_003083 [Chilo suppressalis]|nr:hypothetical protein evm_003083 [Chilo suppressalis]
MSKRYVFNQQHGERKKARLDVTISDHNFPLSQNTTSKAQEPDNWGDENDDEILLLASQACEQAYNDISTLPDYSLCMQPEKTSTQYEPAPSSSKNTFTFKKPSSNPASAITTHLKNKCSTISSPLPGISNKVEASQNENVTFGGDDLVFNDKICKGQDPDFMFRQLLKLQEENAKLKSENGKLLEKCVTKEGESSILRTQLKSCQVAVDNARMDKIKAQEQMEIDWTEKLTAVNKQMCDLRTQLDFKNLEIISVKEKCKKLESNKLRLTQVTVANNDISSSHRNNNRTFSTDIISQIRNVKTISNGIQTEDKAAFIKLNKIARIGNSKLITILPFILENSDQQHHSILDYNEKLQKQSDYSQTKCRIFSTFHRIPSSPVTSKDTTRSKLNLSDIYEDLTVIATRKEEGESLKARYFNLFGAIDSVLRGNQSELDAITLRVTNAFQKEMDEKYVESTSVFLSINKEDLLRSSALYKDEQAIVSRRLTAVAAYILESPESFKMYKMYEEQSNKTSGNLVTFVDSINRICNLLDSTYCAVLYSGFLLALTILLVNFLQNMPELNSRIMDIAKVVLGSRPMPFVSTSLLRLFRKLSTLDNFMATFCPVSNSSNLKVDYDQGVLLYKKDSCYVQVLIKQIEAALKCMEAQKLTREALQTTQNLIALYSNLNFHGNAMNQNRRCDCQLMLIQVIVYSLRICAVMLKDLKNAEDMTFNRQLLAVCRSGVQVLYQCTLRDVEFSSQLSHNEGHFIDLCEILKEFDHKEICGNMLTELTSTFQVSPEETSISFHKQPWLKSFKSFSLAD